MKRNKLSLKFNILASCVTSSKIVLPISFQTNFISWLMVPLLSMVLSFTMCLSWTWKIAHNLFNTTNAINVFSYYPTTTWKCNRISVINNFKSLSWNIYANSHLQIRKGLYCEIIIVFSSSYANEWPPWGFTLIFSKNVAVTHNLKM